MNEEDKAALAAWVAYRAADDMLGDTAYLKGIEPTLTARRIRAAAFVAWDVALNVATLKGGR